MTRLFIITLFITLLHYSWPNHCNPPKTHLNYVSPSHLLPNTTFLHFYNNYHLSTTCKCRGATCNPFGFVLVNWFIWILFKGFLSQRIKPRIQIIRNQNKYMWNSIWNSDLSSHCQVTRSHNSHINGCLHHAKCNTLHRFIF